jgi:hypothetical protein
MCELFWLINSNSNFPDWQTWLFKLNYKRSIYRSKHSHIFQLLSNRSNLKSEKDLSVDHCSHLLHKTLSSKALSDINYVRMNLVGWSRGTGSFIINQKWRLVKQNLLHLSILKIVYLDIINISEKNNISYLINLIVHAIIMILNILTEIFIVDSAIWITNPKDYFQLIIILAFQFMLIVFDFGHKLWMELEPPKKVSIKNF